MSKMFKHLMHSVNIRFMYLEGQVEEWHYKHFKNYLKQKITIIMRVLYFDSDKGYTFSFQIQTIMLLLKIITKLALTITF